MKFSISRYTLRDKKREKKPLTNLDNRVENTPFKRFGRNRFKARNFAESLGFAWEGLWHIFSTQRNFRIDLIISLGVIACGIIFQLTTLEWVSLAIVITMVLFAESANTALEYTVDLYTQGEFDMRAKVIKDIAAGACLLCAFFAAIVGMLIFWPYFSAILFL